MAARFSARIVASIGNEINGEYYSKWSGENFEILFHV